MTKEKYLEIINKIEVEKLFDLDLVRSYLSDIGNTTFDLDYFIHCSEQIKNPMIINQFPNLIQWFGVDFINIMYKKCKEYYDKKFEL